MTPLSTHFDAAGKANMFDALERAATQLGVALFVVHVDAVPPVVIYASELLCELVNRPNSDITGRPPWELVAPAEQDRVRKIIASRGPGAPPLTLQSSIERPDGVRRDIEVGVARITTSDAELAVCSFRDATSEHEALEAVRRSEARFRSLIELAPDGVVILQRGRIVLANPAAVQMFGAPDFESVRHRTLADFLPAEDVERAMARIAQIHAGIEQGASDYRVIASDRIAEVLSVPYEYDNKPAILAYVRDVTDHRRMQDRLLRSDRLAALGTMAATVAHEINNPLAYLQLNLQQLEIEAASDPDPARAAMFRDLLANALHGVQRITRIVRDLRGYTRDDLEDVERPVDVVSVVEGALAMVGHDLRHRAQLIRRYPDQPAIVDAIQGRLEQVIVNVMLNALQSLDGSDPAKDQISVEIEVDQHHVTLAITDTGRGIAEPERIFDPYFTTKPMGLSVCKQIVEGMRGRIEIESTIDKGTKITIVLPAGTMVVSPQVSPQVSQEPDHQARSRILVIDDEPYLRASMEALLSSEHDVETAADGETALAILEKTPFDLILCDLMMPRMNGRDVYEQIARRWPGLERRVIFVTGGAFIPALAGFLESVDNLKLRKPFTVESVFALIREARARS